MNSALFEMLLDAVHGRDALTADQVIDLLHCIHKDTSLTSHFPKMFSLQLLSSRFYSFQLYIMMHVKKVIKCMSEC